MWRRLRKFLAEKLMPAAEQLEEKADAEIQEHVPVANGIRVRYLVVAVVLAICVGGYAVHWLHSRVKAASSLTPVATQGGTEGVYSAPQTSGMEKAGKKGVKPRSVVRHVATYRTEDLPREEQDRIPAIAPAAGPDNVVRPVELAHTAVVPPSRGETDVRSYVLPSGDLMTTLEPKREPFVGWPWKDGNWKRLELEGGPGIGGKQFDAQAAWWPLRVGDFQLGVRGEGWMEPAGGTKGAASVRIRWEPFRSQYR